MGCLVHFFKRTFKDSSSFILWVWECMCHGAHMGVREQLWGVGLLLPFHDVELKGQMQIVRLGHKAIRQNHLYPLSHLDCSHDHFLYIVLADIAA